MLHAVLVGLKEVASVKIILLMIVGVTAGLSIGALPGLTATMAVALLVPMTFPLSPTEGLILLGALYMSAIYGGSFSAILVNTPGTPSSIGTAFDGYPMAKRGEGQRAVLISTFASAYGGIIGVIFLLLLAPPLASVSIRFGPPEYFWLAIFGITIISSLATKNVIKGFIGGAIGILISTIGIAPVGGDVRFTMGISQLQSGIGLIPALIGLFCIPEAIDMVTHREKKFNLLTPKGQPGIVLRTFKEVIKRQVALIRASLIGAFVGILPGAGGSIANLVSYSEAKRVAKHPEKFGTGIPEGIIATEAANNAVVGGGMIPLLTLGIPGAPPDAVLYGALLIHGLRPGPELFTGHSQVVFTFIVALFVATLLMIPVGITIGSGLSKLVNKLPIKVLVPFIIFLTIVGAYSIRNNILDVYVMLVLGILGYVLKRFGFHPGPITLGLILGPIGETGFVQALLVGETLPNRWMIFFEHPLSWLLIVLSIASLSWPLFRSKLTNLKHTSEGGNK